MNGSVECFKYCTELKHLDISYVNLKEDFFTNIHLFIPKLQTLYIETCEQFSDSFIDSFNFLKSIEKAILFRINHDIEDINHDIEDINHDIEDINHDIEDINHDIEDINLYYKKYWYFGKC